MRIVITVLVASLLAVTAAQAQDAAKCGTLQMVNTVPLFESFDGRQDLVPIVFEKGVHYFTLDTGGAVTSLSMAAAQDMQLHTFDSDRRLADVAGHSSNKMATVDVFALGHMRGGPANFPIAPITGASDGLFALDYLMKFDADFDFSNRKLNIFSPDHCPGAVRYWKAPAVAVLPMSQDTNLHITIPVELDGHTYTAIVDTGAETTTFSMELAKNDFDLTMGAPDTPQGALLNGSLTTYDHVFKALTFDSVTVSNPHITILPPPPFGYKNVRVPDMTIGMDVLRKLHLYVAFQEKKIYISQADPAPPAQPLPAAYIANRISTDNYVLSATPDHDNVAAFIGLCQWKAIAKTDLAAALDDCNQALKLKPNDSLAMTARALVYYQQGQYQNAASDLDTVLKADPKLVFAIALRGRVKAKLGDQTGAAADAAAAIAINADAPNDLVRIGIAE